jgi:hypothetical protein
MDPTLFPFADPMSGFMPQGSFAPAPLPENPYAYGPGVQPGFGGTQGDAALRGALYVPPSQTAGSVGGNVGGRGGIGSDYAASGGQGIGEERPSSATSTSGRGAPLSTALQGALRGVQAGAPPQAQTVRTPPPLQPRPIQGGELVSMLTSLGITPQEFVRMGGLKLRG